MRAIRLEIFALAFVLSLVLSPALGPALANGEVRPMPRTEMGAGLYMENCRDCHGSFLDARGDAPNLAGYARGEDAFRATVRDGFYPMPSFEGAFSDEELEALWDYISSASL